MPLGAPVGAVYAGPTSAYALSWAAPQPRRLPGLSLGVVRALLAERPEEMKSVLARTFSSVSALNCSFLAPDHASVRSD